MLTKISRLVLKKKNKSKIVCLTAYSKNIAEEIDNYTDLILVGDSLGSVLYNFDTTRKVNLSMMIEHSKSVRKGVKKSLMIVDMPYNTYKNKSQALKNCKKVMKETKRMDNEKGRYTLVFLAAPNDENAEIELTYNWDGDNLGEGSRNFGHLAYRVDNIYETCQRLKDMGYTINRPPRDGHMAFVRSPDKISVEILQEGNLEPVEPWKSMENTGTW